MVSNKDSILGIDFTGGDEMTVAFEEKIDTSSQVDVTIVDFKGIFVILLQ